VRKQTTISQWIAALPEDTGAIRVRVGSGRSLPVCAVFRLEGAKVSKGDHDPIECDDLDDLANQAELAAQDAGWPIEYTTARIHAYTMEGLEKRSKLFRHQPAPEAAAGMSPEWGIIGRLVDGNLAMMAEARKSIDILTETLAHRETLTAEALENALQSRQDAQDAEMQAYAQSLVVDERLAFEEDDPTPGIGHEILGQVAQVLMAQAGGGLADVESLKDLVNNRPDILDDLVNDDDLVGQVLGAYQARMNREAEAPADEPGTEADPIDHPVATDAPPE
jgi:hypothetical protein